MSDLSFPIGRHTLTPALSPDRRVELIDQIAAAPAALAAAIAGLSDRQLDTPYRPGGWTIRQVVHHVPDSHLNAYVRLKLALTEDDPTIRPYDQDRWAGLADARLPLAVSLSLLASLHERWVGLWRAIEAADFARTLRHPEMGPMTLDALLGLYAWHGRHHIAHVTAWRERAGV